MAQAIDEERPAAGGGIFTPVNALLDRIAGYFTSDMERAAIVRTPEQLRRTTLLVIGFAVLAWAAYIEIFRPGAMLAGIYLIAFFAATFYGVKFRLRGLASKRLVMFNNQLEIVLRLVVSALRVGLGLRQAIGMVINEMPAPASIEFGRAMAQTSIGMSIEDALDQVATRMPSTEMLMLAKAIRIQTKTGGNLAKTLTNLAEMIKQRRRIARRIKSLTSEARSTRWIITALPVGVTAFIMIAEPDLRAVLLETNLGHLVLGIAFVMLSIGWWLFGKIGQIDV